MKRHIWIAIIFVSLEMIWSGYSGFTYFGAAFSDYSDDKYYHEINVAYQSLIFWRWFAVSLVLGTAIYFFRRGADV